MNANPDRDKMRKVARLLKKCESIFFVTGAGISADSGLPTYRGIGGLYNDKSTDEDMPIEMALAGSTLATNPAITWKYLSQIESNCRDAKYNRGHEVIAQMQDYFKRVWVLTQNIDGFHRAAGSKDVIEIHGDMHRLYCPSCGLKITVKDYSEIDIPPRCKRCGHIIRPDVVFFGEMLPIDMVRVLHEEERRGFDIYFSIGTTSVFPYIQEPILTAHSLKKPTVEINPDETEVSSIVDIKIRGRAKDVLDAILDEYLKT